jgi:hypothetical protein
MITPKYLSAASAMGGLKNYQTVNFSVSVPSQTLNTILVYTATGTLDNANSVCQVQVQFNGMSTSYYVLYGNITVPNPASSSATWEIISGYYFNGGTVYVWVAFYNLTSSALTIPTITVNCIAKTFIAPF